MARQGLCKSSHVAALTKLTLICLILFIMVTRFEKFSKSLWAVAAKVAWKKWIVLTRNLVRPSRLLGNPFIAQHCTLIEQRFPFLIDRYSGSIERFQDDFLFKLQP